MKYVLVSVSFLLLFLFSTAQKIVCNLNTGYAFGCSFDAYHDTANYYAASIDPGIKYGLDLGYKLDRNFSFDLSLQYQNAMVPSNVHYNGNNLSQTLQVNVLWIQAGGTSYLPANHFEFTLGTYLGMGVYRFSELPTSDRNSFARFGWSVRGGCGYYFSKRIGLNVRSDALFSTDPLSKPFSTPGLSNGKTGYTFFFQFGLSTGLTILLF